MYDRRQSSSKSSEQTVHLLSEAGRAADAMLAERLGRRGLGPVHQLVLSTLAEHGPHARFDLAVQVEASEADASRIIDELLAAGLLDSMVVHAGGRRQLVSLAPAGQTMLTTLRGDATAAQDDLLAPLTRGERTELNYLLRRVCAGAAARGRARPAAR
ncbi:MarR family winged helix-turn-helix transcriptional regulator [Kitasatospora sp. NBC_00070]|uniref:MarR family winged helix-turn-helix transcriptional regulator n=1 Tax=Kitasatospora sp. NBC_00070 TaxID=2975962 RepID=UPI003254FED5